MRVVSFVTSTGREAIGVLREEGVLDFSRAMAVWADVQSPRLVPVGLSVEALIYAEMLDPGFFASVLDLVEACGLQGILTVGEAKLLPPILPKRIIALGRNYAAHAQETGHKPPKEPVFFMKATTSVIGPEEPVVCPPRVGRIDHEVELAVVIGRGGKRISRARAMQHVAGYTILNDVTARDMQTRDMAASHPWFLSKSFDTFGPMGPCLALPDEIPDPMQLDLELRVNGEVRQKSNTRDMLFDIPDLIHRLSRYITLEPGDVVSTGTPEGISPIHPGDVMEAEIEGIGVLRNPVVAGR
jgi:5-oxopent-3-ene-1,2,5-tricarboxylate decarboxylase/2-hydroxyhepta-2,4-diene-1,7-dioate isomerase